MNGSGKMKNTSLGIDENIEGLLCYVLGWITGIVFLLLEKDNRFVKFHALQSMITFGILNVFYVVLAAIPFVGMALGWIVIITSLIVWVISMLKAYEGEMYKLPYVGDVVEKGLR